MIKKRSTLRQISIQVEGVFLQNENMHTKGYRRKDVDFSQYLNNGISSR